MSCDNCGHPKHTVGECVEHSALVRVLLHFYREWKKQGDMIHDLDNFDGDRDQVRLWAMERMKLFAKCWRERNTHDGSALF